MIAYGSRCWSCGSMVAEDAQGVIICATCGPLTVPEGYERRYENFTGRAVLRRIDYCTACGSDTCLGCEGA